MIESINSNYNLIDPNKVNNTNQNKKPSFSMFLKDSISEVNDLQVKSDQITEQFAQGKVDNIHEVTIASEKANLALNLTMAVHNKVVDAYKELMRMQV